MSNVFPADKSSRRKPGGGMFFLIILAVGGYLIFSNLGKPPQGDGVIDRDNGAKSGAGLEDDGRSYREQREGVLGSENTAQKQTMPTTGKSGSAGDWEMDDVTTKKDSTGSATTKSGSSKTQSGDWAIEDVDPKNKADSQFQFSTKAKSETAKSSGGDWEIEDVDKKKKTKSGDWEIEETNTSKKKDK